MNAAAVECGAGCSMDVRGSGDGGGMDDDGQAGAARRRLARGTAPKGVAGGRTVGDPAKVTTSSAGAAATDAPAGSIVEAIERLMSDREAEEAIAEWDRRE